ncbi:MAG: NrdH-redoxin [SAR202 cluster bacterium]|jgi:glutaredoxin-like protein|nr:NrdH-redoxin [SAR202 cluster bacterium]MQG53344.1 NrdH-redoxin [SAR202 cluster bacterium]|tara:strand:- start:1534 stop:1773 length:240 start_codon:yes stop_codon:yes gene_type:complete
MDIKMYGTTWCGDCKRAKAFFERHDIEYDWFDTDTNEEFENYVKSLNNGNRVVPTIIFADGSMLVEPSDEELSEKLLIK